MTREDAQRKVRALRATAAPGSGAFPAEREIAARLADQLTAEHGLDRPALARAPVERHYNNGSRFSFGFANNIFNADPSFVRTFMTDVDVKKGDTVYVSGDGTHFTVVRE